MKTARIIGLLLFAGLAVSLPAQVAFTYRTSAGPSTTTVSNNGSIVFAPTEVGTSSTVTLIATNASSAESINLISGRVTGTTVFTMDFTPAQVRPSGFTTLTLTFTPTTRSQVTGGLELNFTTGAGVVTYSFFLSGNGQAGDLVASYILLPDGNQVPVTDGGAIAFPRTPVQATSTATFVIANRGNAAGTVSAVTVAGEQFRVSGLPLFPAAIAPDRDLRFSVIYAPQASGPAAGSLRVNLGGRQLNVNLTGEGASAALLYEFVTAGGVTPITAGSTVQLPETPLGTTSSGVVRVRNTGTLEGRIGAAAVVGAAFRLADVPPLPVTIPPGGTISFALQFTPAEAGAAAGTLIVGDFSVPVSGTGVGALLTLAARVGSTITPLASGGSFTFPNTTVGSAGTAHIRVTNSGNAPGAVNGISLSVPAFSFPSLPALPASIAPGETLEFAVEFTPAAPGLVTGTLQIDDRTVSLRGIGDNPPPLPAVTIAAPETAQPLDQPPVSLRIAEPYPVDLTGRLTLSFLSESFGDDPNIQFSTGGRTAEFRIAAGTTEAVFGETARAVPFQAGTVAGEITVTAAFHAGSTVVTPNPAPSRTINVPAGPPLIRNVQAGDRSASSFQVLISGMATTRSITRLNLQFTPAEGANLMTTSLSIDVEGPFTAWYGSTTGRSFGSQFTATLVINVNGDVSAVQSVSVSAVNALGASPPVSVNLR